MQGLINIALFLFIAGIAVASLYGIPLLIVYCLCVFAGAKGRAEKVQAKLSASLMQGEEVIAKALQLRTLALINRRVFLAITSSRVICIRRGLLGGFTMEDIQWKDLSDVRISENILPAICGSNLSFLYHFAEVGKKAEGEETENKDRKTGGGELVVVGVPADTALRIYSRSQAEEQAWQEKRRIRNIEEIRAAAGGVVVNGPAPNSPSAGREKTGESLFEEIEKAKKLLDSGAISDAEFNEIKSKILSKNY